MRAVIDRMSEAFGLGPTAVLAMPRDREGSDQGADQGCAGLCAALWHKPAPGNEIVAAPPMQDTAILSFHLERSFEMDFRIDSCDVYRGRTGPGDVCLVPPGTAPEAEVRGDATVFHIYVAADRLPDLGAMPNLEGPRFAHMPQLQREVAALVDGARDDGTQLWALARFGRLVELAGAFVDAVRPLGGRERLTLPQRRRAEALIDRGYDQPIRVADLAAALDMSEAHFARAFRNATGRTPGSALRVRRMEAARELLARSGLPIGDVAAAVGYDDPGYFARSFRQLHGRTPQAWRRLARGAPALGD